MQDLKPRSRIGLVVASLAMLLAGCALFSPSTTVTVDLVRADGVTLKAAYHSTKDVAAPSFVFQRNPETGQIETIQLTAEGTSASQVIDANANMLGAAIGAGVAAGLRASGAP
jgi:hypothetical protein